MKIFILDFIKSLKLEIEILLLFIHKKDINELYLYIDFRNINNNIISNRYLILFILKILNCFRKVKIFTKLDLYRIYNLIRIYLGNK